MAYTSFSSGCDSWYTQVFVLHGKKKLSIHGLHVFQVCVLLLQNDIHFWWCHQHEEETIFPWRDIGRPNITDKTRHNYIQRSLTILLMIRYLRWLLQDLIKTTYKDLSILHDNNAVPRRKLSSDWLKNHAWTGVSLYFCKAKNVRVDWRSNSN